MSYKPQVISFDFESNSLEFWSPDFQVLSTAFAWRTEDGTIKTKVTEGKDETATFLKRCADNDIPLVCHNYAFEWAVTTRWFPDIPARIGFDTMRLVQVYDNGGDGDKPKFGLADCVARIIPEHAGHKEPYYKWIRENLNVKKGKEKGYVSRLPTNLLHEYNIADAIVTLLLFEKITEEFRTLGYDWSLDHTLYLSLCRQVSQAKANGIRVDRDRLSVYRSVLQRELRDIDEAFKARFAKEIAQIEAVKREAWIGGCKSERGRAKRLEQVEQKPEVWTFNPKSTKHLKELFVDVLGIQPQFFTPKGAPSLKASHIRSYGEGGEMLANRNKRLLVLKQTEALLALSEKDGRWHVDLKVTGTATGRAAGGTQQ